MRLAPPGGGSGELVPPSLAENEAAHPAQPLTTRERESASCSNSQAAGPSAAVLHQLPLLVPDLDPEILANRIWLYKEHASKDANEIIQIAEKPISLKKESIFQIEELIQSDARLGEPFFEFPSKMSEFIFFVS